MKCDYPILNGSQTVQVMGYANPSLEGTPINFTCPTGQVLSGPKTSTCLEMENGNQNPLGVTSDAKVCMPIIKFIQARKL